MLPKGPWPAPLALGFVLLVFAPLIGALLYRVVIRGLQDTSEIVKLVVPISVLLAAIGLANWVWKPTDSHSIQPFFGADHKVTVFGVVLLWHDLTILFVAVALAVGLRVLLYRTRVGVSMRAVVDDRPLLELNGARPDRVSLVSWMIGVSLSALAGILITPFQGWLAQLDAPDAARDQRVRGGHVRSAPQPPVDVRRRRRAGLRDAHGVRTADRAHAQVLRLGRQPSPRRPDDPVVRRVARSAPGPPAGRGGVPHARALRDAVDDRRRHRCGIAFVVCIFLLSRIMAASPLLTLSDALAAAIIILSLVLLVGFAGEVSLATMALAGIGGTVLYHHVGHGATSRAGIMAFVIAVVATALVGAVIALPALRLRGLYLALATAAFSLAVEQMVFKEYAGRAAHLSGDADPARRLRVGRRLPRLHVAPGARRAHRRGRVGRRDHARRDQPVAPARAMERDLPQRRPAGTAPAPVRHRLQPAGQLSPAARDVVFAVLGVSMIASGAARTAAG